MIYFFLVFNLLIIFFALVLTAKTRKLYKSVEANRQAHAKLKQEIELLEKLISLEINQQKDLLNK